MVRIARSKRFWNITVRIYFSICPSIYLSVYVLLFIYLSIRSFTKCLIKSAMWRHKNASIYPRGMSENQKAVQEALFEVISSEASYLKSLNILISHFVQSPQFSGIFLSLLSIHLLICHDIDILYVYLSIHLIYKFLLNQL